MTWAEAKAKVGESSTSGGKKKKPTGLAGTKNHATHHAAKIIQKATAQGETDQIKDRQAARLARRDAQRQEQLEAQREAAKEQAKLDQIVKPYDLAMERLSKLANAEALNGPAVLKNHTANDVTLDLAQVVCECRQIQLDEILALEAIYEGAETVSILAASRLEDQRTAVESWQMDEDNETLQQSILDFPPLSFTLKLLMENDDTSDTLSSEAELVSLVLLKVTFPPLYPLYDGQTPLFEVVECTIVDKMAVCNRNKPLESLGYLRQDDFTAALTRQAQELYGVPSVYELVSTWLPEVGLFSSFVTMNSTSLT